VQHYYAGKTSIATQNPQKKLSDDGDAFQQL